MNIPSSWASIPDWMRMVAAAVNPSLNGYPFLSLADDPPDPAHPGFTYYNTTTDKVRTWDGAAWNNHY